MTLSSNSSSGPSTSSRTPRARATSPVPATARAALTVLDHPNRDCIVVGQIPDGPSIYASVPDYAPRAAGEPAEQALARLRQSIDRTKDRGSIVEFVQQRDWTARRGEVPLELARKRLRDFCATGRSLDFEGPLRPPPYGESRERSVNPPRDAPPPGAPVAAREAVARSRNPELNQRRYDWSPPVPNGPREAEVESAPAPGARGAGGHRAQGRRAPRRGGTRTVARCGCRGASGARSEGTFLGRRADRRSDESLGPKKNNELNRRRSDWTPEPPGLEAIRRATRGRSTDRDR